MIKALFKFDKHIPQGAKVIDTTLNDGIWSELSPFILSAYPAKRFENLWQFSKVYSCHVDKNNNIKDCWFEWRNNGFANYKAIRYPMKKGTIPLFSYWQDEKLDYISARKKIYIPEYSKNVLETNSFKLLQSLYSSLYEQNILLILLDFDAYDYQKLGISLKNVVNNPKRKCGHAFVLLSLLTGEPLI